jgi:hypothetical protein
MFLNISLHCTASVGYIVVVTECDESPHSYLQEAAGTARVVAVLWDGPHDMCFVRRGGFALVTLDGHRR